MLIALGFALAMAVRGTPAPAVRISEDCTGLVVSDPDLAEAQWDRFIDGWLGQHASHARAENIQGSVARATTDYVRTLMGPNCRLVEARNYYPDDGTDRQLAAIWLLLFKPMSVAFEGRGIPMPRSADGTEWTTSARDVDDLWWEIAQIHGLDLDAVNAVLVQKG